MPSNIKFGWFFSAVFVMIALYSYIKGLYTFAFVATILIFLFLISILFSPKLLTPINRLWYDLGLLLGKIISPIVLAVMFFLIISPIALVTRLFGRDELKLKKLSLQSYWVNRQSSESISDSFKNQF
jgi:hypothetical protein